MTVDVSHSVERRRVALMLALTLISGIVDAVSFLGLGHVFTANMTGNVVLLGLAISGAADLTVVRPLLALAGFVAGAVIAGRVHRHAHAAPVWPRQSTYLLGAVAIMLAGLSLLLALTSRSDSSQIDAVVTCLLGLAMGLQAGTARHLRVTDMPTVVLTSTLTSLAADSRFGGGDSERWVRRAAAVATLALGAVMGALLLRIGIAVALGFAALVMAAAVVLASRMLGRSEP